MKNRTSLKEYRYLIPLSRRIPIYLIEFAKIIKAGNDIRVLRLKDDLNNDIYTLPVASIACLMLGSGCSITSEAIRICASRGCIVHFTGGGGAPLYAITTQHRSPINRIKQIKKSFNQILRIELAKTLLNERAKLIDEFNDDFNIPVFPSVEDLSNISELFSLEGKWAKQAYHEIAIQHSLRWPGKTRAEEENHPIIFLNHLSYSIADISIRYLGLDPDIGIMHGRTKGGGLSYDIADIFKPLLALVPSMIAINKKQSMTQIKNNFISNVYKYKVIDRQCSILESMFLS